MSVPTLETSRLILRGHAIEDFPACHAMWSDSDVMRFLGGPNSEEDAWAKFMRFFGHWRLMGYGFWSVVERASGRRVGEAGFLNYKRAMIPSLDGTPEVGWSLERAAQGKGYATEAVTAVLAWGDRHFGRVRMVCIVAPDNLPSLRLAERCGFAEGARTTYKDKPIVVLYREPDAASTS